MNNMYKCGIYIIYNDKSGKFYIGSTGITFAHRWSQHKCDLRANRHKNKHLQSAWDKYGEEVFRFIILEIMNDNDIIIEREQKWLNNLEFVLLYNTAINAEAPRRGLKNSAEHNRKVGMIHKGRKHSRETKERMGKPYPTLVNKNTGEIIPSGRNISAICQMRKLHISNMRQVIRGKRRSCQEWMVLKD